MKRLTLLTMASTVIAGALWTNGSAIAQSYGSTQVKNILSRNSAEQYTVDRINRQVMNNAVPPSGVGGINRQNYIGAKAAQNFAAPRQPLVGGGMSSGRSKPFATLNRGPTVSPYLALNNPFSTAEDYYNIVRPLQEQRRTNEALQRQQISQARRLNQMAAQGPFQITGSEAYAPTGHGSGFMRMGNYMNMGGYFPPPTQAKSAR